MNAACPNCNHLLQEHFRYCPNCSQKTRLHRLSFHDILHDAMHYFTHADKGIFGLVKNLATKHGRIAAEFVAGKRKMHFPPFNFYLIVATLFVLSVQWFTPEKPFDLAKEHPELQKITDKTERERRAGIYTRQHEAVSFMNKYSNTMMMIALPLICFLYWLFYMKGKYNYVEHLVACMYMLGFVNLVFTLFFLPLRLIFNVKEGSQAALKVVLVFMLFEIIYSAIFYYRFMNQGTRASAWKAFGVSFFVVVFWLVVSSLLVALYIAKGF